MKPIPLMPFERVKKKLTNRFGTILNHSGNWFTIKWDDGETQRVIDSEIDFVDKEGKTFLN